MTKRWNYTVTETLKKRLTAGTLAAVMTVAAAFAPATVLADRVDDKPYLALGADLNEEQKAVVLQLLEVDAAQLENYTVSEVTNEEEHQYLGEYLDASVIGTKALSSVKVVGCEEGHGIEVTTYNISYCTEGMYQNALATAGVEDAEVTVAGPFSISGTAALVGAMEAYAAMTGQVIQPELMDGATNELVVTSELAESIGAEKAVDLIAALKQILAENDLSSEDKMNQAIDDVAAKLEVELSEEDRQLIRDLLEKLSDLDLDWDMIKDQASELYDRISNLDLSEYGITEENVSGFLGQIMNFFSNLIDSLKGLFQ